MSDPDAYRSHPLTAPSAKMMFERQASHQCYWNDSFCVAILCNMERDFQRLGAWCAVTNGINNYWEWRTHAGYDMAAALRYAKVVDDAFVPPSYQALYYDLNRKIIDSLIEAFELPTSLRSGKSLSAQESRERDLFNKQYPYVAQL